MEIFNVLLVDNNLELGRIIQNDLTQTKRYTVTLVGKDDYIMDIVNTTKFDVVVFDLISLQSHDLERLKEVVKSKKLSKTMIIGTSAISNDMLVERLGYYGIDFFIQKPYNSEKLINFLDSLIMSKLNKINIGKAVNTDYDYTQEITFAEVDPIDHFAVDFLNKIGLRSSLSGYDYIRYGFKLIIEGTVSEKYLTKDLYPRVAKNKGVKPHQVERNIRHSIQSACDDRQFENYYFMTNQYKRKGKPTNSVFIASMVEYYKIESKKNVLISTVGKRR